MDSDEGLTIEHAYSVPTEGKEAINYLEILKGKNIAKANPAKYKFHLKLEHDIPRGAKLEIMVPPGVSANQQVSTADESIVTSGLEIT